LNSLILQSGLNQIAQDEIEKLTRKFLRSGGAIERVAKGLSGNPVMKNRSMHTDRNGNFISKENVKKIHNLAGIATNKGIADKFKITQKTLRDITGAGKAKEV